MCLAGMADNDVIIIIPTRHPSPCLPTARINDDDDVAIANTFPCILTFTSGVLHRDHSAIATVLHHVDVS
jgi:hypothetical protein